MRHAVLPSIRIRYSLIHLWLPLAAAACDGGGGIADPPPSADVASVVVTAPSISVEVGKTVQLTATVKDASGNLLSGRTVTWSSSNTGVATVSAAGAVTGVSAGSVTLTAECEGKKGTAAVTVAATSAARVTVTPNFTTVDVGQSHNFQVTAFDASGSAIRNPSAAWISASNGVATVSSTGSASGVAVGQTRIVAQVNQAKGEATLAVLGPTSLLSTAFVGGAVEAPGKPGEVISVPVTLDLSRVSSTGDLGSVQFDLTYDVSVLQYESATAGISGSTTFNVPTPGTFKFSFAGTNPQGKAQLTLATISFRVAPGAAVGTERELKLTYTARPSGTNFNSYELPIGVGGRFRVTSP